jgi:hypothetical protein
METLFAVDGLNLTLSMNVARQYILYFSAFFVKLALHNDRICEAPPHASLDIHSCTINYTANTPTPWAIALKIEDFEASSPEIPLSGTSLQFIVEVYSDTSTCKTRMWS